MSAGIASRDLETGGGCLLKHSLGGTAREDVVMIKGERLTWPLIFVIQDKVFAGGAVAGVWVVPETAEDGR